VLASTRPGRPHGRLPPPLGHRVPHIKNLVSVVLDSTSTSYARWRGQVLAPHRYALDCHVLFDTPITARDLVWLRRHNIAMSLIFGTIFVDLLDVVWTHGDTAHQTWLALEG
jgi:hypothetical protein